MENIAEYGAVVAVSILLVREFLDFLKPIYLSKVNGKKITHQLSASPGDGGLKYVSFELCEAIQKRIDERHERTQKNADARYALLVTFIKEVKTDTEEIKKQTI